MRGIMWTLQIAGIELYFLLGWFWIYCFLGWVWGGRTSGEQGLRYRPVFDNLWIWGAFRLPDFAAFGGEMAAVVFLRSYPCDDSGICNS